MTSKQLSPDDISALIEHLLHSQDDSTVGLRRIIKKQVDRESDFPVRNHVFDQFQTEGVQTARTFSDEEVQVLELERKLRRLESQLASQRKDSELALVAAIDKARAGGRAEGIAAARAEAAADYETKLTALQQKLAGFLSVWEKSKREQIVGAERVVAELACRIAQKVVQAELSLNKDIVLSSVKHALTFVADRDRLVIRVAPGDWERVSGAPEFWKPVQERLGEVTILRDGSIQPGGCIVESHSGVADARLGVQLSELSELVDKVWQGVQSSVANEISSASPDAPLPSL